MPKYVELHRHSHFSTYDGFGDCQTAAKRADELGYNSLALTDHGDISGLINHYNACRDNNIKPILGTEAYFQPEFDKDSDYYHLTLLAKNLQGYRNLMKIVSVANRDTFYRNPLVTFEYLEKYNDGLVCMSGCVGGYISQLILGEDIEEENAEEFSINRERFKSVAKEALKFKKIFGDDYYLEIMPLRQLRIQKIANKYLDKISQVADIKAVLTNDSHYCYPDSYSTYKVMHKMKDNDISSLYVDRYIAGQDQMLKLLRKTNPGINGDKLVENVAEIDSKIEEYELDFQDMVPSQDWGEKSSKEKLVEFAKQGLKEKEKWNDEYKEQLKKEIEIVFSHDFEDYFLLTKDIVEYARDKGIKVGFGRGSVGDFLLAYALGITGIDTIKLGTNQYYERFLRKDKKKFPDIDLDFDSNRRDEIIDYLVRKYKGKAAQISTFGYYKERNLMNDLAKVLDIPDDDRDEIKDRLKKRIDGGPTPDLEELKQDNLLNKYDNKYGYLGHFVKLYNQVRYIGKHAGGVAITPDDISKYVGLQRYKGTLQTAYDLDGLEDLNVLKMDILGLSTLSVVNDAEKEAGVEWKEEYLEDEKTYEEFCKGNTAGIFQFEKAGAVDVLKKVQPKNIQEIIACNALNRPAPKQLGILDEYVQAKNGEIEIDKPWAPYSQETYGCLIFQEQVMRICREIGEMGWDDTDKVMKSLRKGSGGELKKKFIKGAKNNGLAEAEAEEMFDNMTLYLFNKGHGAAYSLLSFYSMWLKTHHKIEFFYGVLSNEGRDRRRRKYAAAAAQNDIVIMLPHVNGGASYSIQEVDGEKVIQEGLSNIKGVGAKTAKKIEEKQPYDSVEDFKERLSGRYASKKIVKRLKEDAALQFDDDIYWRKTVDYNAYLRNQDVKIY